MISEIKPVGDLIVVQRLDVDEVSDGGIVLPFPNQKSVGVVKKVGRGILNKRTGVFNTFNIQEGDIVIFQTHRGHSIENYDNSYLFLSMDNVLCIYKKEDLVDGKMDIEINVSRSTNSFLNNSIIGG